MFISCKLIFRHWTVNENICRLLSNIWRMNFPKESIKHGYN